MTNNVKANKAAAEAAKAEAEIAAAIAAEAVKSNFETAREALFATAETYGAGASEGDMSQTKLAFLFNHAVRSGIATEEDAGKVYLAYAKGYQAARIAKGSIVIGDTTHFVHGDSLSDVDQGKGAEKTAVSIFRTFGRPSVVAQGLDMYDDVRGVRESLGVDDRAQSSLFNAFVAVNRAVSKAADDSAKPDHEFVLTADERHELILRAVLKSGKAKSDDEKLAAIVASLGKLVKGGRFGDDLAELHAKLGAVKSKVAGAVPAPTLVTLASIGTPEMKAAA